jgi:hypothetical protein
MSAQIIDIRTHRVAHIGAPRTLRSEVDREVRGYCELLGLSPQQTGLCVAVALQRFANGGAPKNAAAAGKDRADRIFRASPTPPTGPRAA